MNAPNRNTGREEHEVHQAHKKMHGNSFAPFVPFSVKTIQAKQVSLFPILPSVTWDFEF